MGGGWWITLLGTVAALCSIGSFVPQVLTIWREGDTHGERPADPVWRCSGGGCYAAAAGTCLA
jgi:hypothetical protein